VCQGYSALLSATYGVYRTLTPMPGFSFYCNGAGQIVVNNTVLNFNLGAPGGNASNWKPSTATTTTTGAPVSRTTSSKTAGTSQASAASLFHCQLAAIVVLAALMLC
jgi:hypothetical protein